MPNTKQNVIIFIDATGMDFSTPWKIGNLFMNRFATDEDASFEILEVVYLKELSEEILYSTSGGKYDRIFREKIGPELECLN